MRSPGRRSALLLASALAALIGMGTFAGCEKPRRAPAPATPDTARDTVPAAPPLGYRLHPLGGAAALRALQRDLGENRFQLVLKINRLDLAHVRDTDTLQVPEPFLEEPAYSPFPAAVAGLDSLRKLLLVSLRVQAFAAFESGRQVHWGPTSSGREELPTPRGLYHTNWKAKVRHSTIDSAWVLNWCFNLSRWGISLHEYDLPGYPASHSCVRLLAEDAKWIYGWAEQWRLSEDGRTVLREGTPVVIFGEYAYGRRPPWKRLAQDPHATDVGLEEIRGALAAYVPGFGPDSTAAVASFEPSEVADSLAGGTARGGSGTAARGGPEAGAPAEAPP
jgi:hypothetical protein